MDQWLDGLDSWMFFCFSCTANLCYTQRLEYSLDKKVNINLKFKIVSQCYQYILRHTDGGTGQIDFFQYSKLLLYPSGKKVNIK